MTRFTVSARFLFIKSQQFRNHLNVSNGNGLNRYFSTIAPEPISDPQGGLAKELFYDDVRASPFNPGNTIHDEDVLRMKLDEAERTHLTASRKRMHQPLQIFQDLHEHIVEAEVEAEVKAEIEAGSNE